MLHAFPPLPPSSPDRATVVPRAPEGPAATMDLLLSVLESAEVGVVVADAFTQAGRTDAFDIGGYWPVFTWEDGDAFEVVKPWLHYLQWKYSDAAEARGRLTPRPMPPPLDEQAEAELRAGIICGTPDEVAAQIQILGDAAGRAGVPGGSLTFVGRHYFPGMPRDVMRASTRLFAEKVIPQVR